MGYPSLQECVLDLERNGQLVRIRDEVDPDLEVAEIQRRVYATQGPAVLFENLKGCRFPAVCNLFGTIERARFIFRDTLDLVRRAVQLKADPTQALRQPLAQWRLPWTALTSLPRRVATGPVLESTTRVSELPQIRSWPDDGGPFITLPQVYTEDASRPGARHSNVGMYRIQLAGNRYAVDREVGLHYQIHRGIGVHHAQALERGERLRVSIFVGGPPAHTFAAVMPLPEGLSELLFAGMLAGRRFRYVSRNGFKVAADADFCIVGTVASGRTLPEGPFGDHLGYYSLVHDFPVLEVEAVYHRPDAIWPFTVVGRPPQEDTTFGKLIHEITGPMVPKQIPGLHALHAVDAAGVHPLLLALASERYVPYAERRPQELLTIANAILGFNQCSLAKYLLVAAREDAPGLDIDDIEAFLRHVLERADWSRDLHFQTSTTIDTLDYSGTGLNEGSKLVIAAAGKPCRELVTTLPAELHLPPGFDGAELVFPGALVVEGPRYSQRPTALQDIERLSTTLHAISSSLSKVAWVVVVDDARFCAETLRNFLWVTFTRSNPSHDVHGVDSFVDNKHWGCRGPLLIDARIKPHHAPPLIPDTAVAKRIERLGATGGPLHGWL